MSLSVNPSKPQREKTRHVSTESTGCRSRVLVFDCITPLLMCKKHHCGIDSFCCMSVKKSRSLPDSVLM